MRREFIGDLLQTIYLDVCIRDDSYMYINQTGSKEYWKKRYIMDKHNLQDILHDLERKIHPRYTKVIIDCNPATTKLITTWIDDKYNHYIPMQKVPIYEGSLHVGYKIIPEQMLEMVQVVKYHPKRIDIKEFMKNRTVYMVKNK